jgi:hypothetical protein
MSIYVGCKDCLVMSYEGNVRVHSVPQNTRRSKVVEVAREVLQEKLNKPLTGLNNIEYIVNDIPDDVEYYSVNWKDTIKVKEIPINKEAIDEIAKNIMNGQYK